ncbi:MAG: hypothetical protein SVX43_22575, partial [Cyanobacteriota bacterium]|nr:hypothetical protein [Cyanobacteriota bacterium]
MGEVSADREAEGEGEGATAVSVAGENEEDSPNPSNANSRLLARSSACSMVWAAAKLVASIVPSTDA